MKRMMMILTLCAATISVAYGEPFSNVTPAGFSAGMYSVVAWGDVDANGYDDLFLGGTAQTGSKLFMSLNGDWTDASDQYGIDAIEHVRSARFVDYDRDGLLDLFCLTGNTDGAELYRQNENQRYQRASLHLEQSADASVRSMVFCDTDGDGAPEILLSNRSSVDDAMVVLTQNSPEYVEVRGADDPFTETNVSRISPVDFDQDGDLDYFLTKSDGEAALWVNHEDRYYDLGEETDLPHKIGDDGVTWADFDRNGYLDFFACGSSASDGIYYQSAPDEQGEMPSFTLRNDLCPAFLNLENVRNAHAVDINGDGWTDLFLARHKGAGNEVILNLGGNGWRQLLDHGLRFVELGCMSAAWCDYDHDGDFDVAMAQGGAGATLFRNNMEPRNEYIGLKLCGSDDCATPVLDCLVEINFPEIGKQWAATSMYSTTADGATKYLYNASNEHSESFEVRVLWPNGAVSTYTENQIVLWAINELHMPLLPTPDADGFIMALALPVEPELGNYPNPFNPTTTVSFTLSEPAFVSLSVYNLLGQQVATLANEGFEAGSHSLVFDASSLTSGMYLVRLEAPGQSVVHRMLLSK
ncbi:MAG: T9SS type A sorting domain-containing protein [bacterium]|nr:T9SS type A sorting domain-containing protein [bacterium]